MAGRAAERQAGSFGGTASGGAAQPPTTGAAGLAPMHTSDTSGEQQERGPGGTELGRFLRARRSQVTPADVGFTAGTGVRRTPGLRREEVAAGSLLIAACVTALGWAGGRPQ